MVSKNLYLLEDQPIDAMKRQLKVTKHDLAKIKDRSVDALNYFVIILSKQCILFRFSAFLRGETQIIADEAFTKAIQSYTEVTEENNCWLLCP